MVRKVKLYANRNWLYWAYHEQKYTPEEIAELANTSLATVYRYLKHYKIML